jgi:hypothetical protein
MWRIHMDKGQVPKSLQGDWTTYGLAKKAVEQYVKSQKRTVVEEKK